VEDGDDDVDRFEDVAALARASHDDDEEEERSDDDSIASDASFSLHLDIGAMRIFVTRSLRPKQQQARKTLP